MKKSHHIKTCKTCKQPFVVQNDDERRECPYCRNKQK